MKQIMKNRKAVAAVLLLAMLFSIMPTAVWAEDADAWLQQSYSLKMGVSAEITTAQALMMNIAKSHTESSDEWMIMDMAAYLHLGGSHQTSEEVKKAYVNSVIQKVAQPESLGETDYAKAIIILTALGIDPTCLYPVNSNTPVSAVDELNALIDKNLNSETGYIFNAWVTPYTLLAYQQGNYGGERVEKLLEATVNGQAENGSWDIYSPVQATPTVMASITKFVSTDEDIKAAIDNAIDYLSDMQQKDGRFQEEGEWYFAPDSNTSSMVLTGLAAAGINPEKDERFIKDNGNAFSGLLYYAFADNTAFGYQDNISEGYGTTEQGFRALIAASQVMKTGNAFNVYDFSGNKLVPGRATGSGQVSKPSTPSGSQNITVTVSIKGLDGYWLKDKNVTLKDDATMYWALTEAIKDTAITQTGAENGYVSEMSNGSISLAEFDYGRNSGWLYKVNEKLPEVGILEYNVKNGDKIVWYYTKNWTQDSLAGARVDSTDKEAAAAVDKLIGKIGELDNITKDSEAAIRAAREAYDALTDKQKALVDKYDDLTAAEAMLEVLLAGQEELPFTDTENHWAKEAICFVYDRGLLRGVSDGQFAPDADFSRAMLVTVLHRMAGSPAANGANPFHDVRDTAWYANPVSWAYQNKLAGGMDADTYAPESPITREQLAVMLMRYAQYCGYDTSDTIRLVHYKDAASVSSYAEAAVKWAVSTGLIKGRTANELKPQGTATRAEVAVMLQRFCQMYDIQE